MCLIFSVLSTIDEYSEFANETLFWMVSRNAGVETGRCEKEKKRKKRNETLLRLNNA